MADGAAALPWDRPGWRGEIAAWAAGALAARGIAPQGEWAEQQRPWSAVLRTPTSAGTVFCKATAPSLAYEPALTAALAAWYPDLLPGVVAADPARGWLLLADAGATLRSQIASADDLWHWERVLPRYAELQIALAGRRDELLALGALDRRLATLPAKYAALLDDAAALRLG